MLLKTGYYFLKTHVTEARAGWSYISAINTYVRIQATVFSIHALVSVAINANSLRDLVSEEVLINSTSPYAFVDGSNFIFTLMFKKMYPPAPGAAARLGPWPPYSWGFQITQNDAPNSVGLLWTSDQIVAKTCTWTTQHSRQTHSPQARFETEIQASKRPHTHALDRAATGTDKKTQIPKLFTFNSVRQLHCFCCNSMQVQKHSIWSVCKICYQIIGWVLIFLCKFTTACCTDIYDKH